LASPEAIRLPSLKCLTAISKLAVPILPRQAPTAVEWSGIPVATLPLTGLDGMVMLRLDSNHFKDHAVKGLAAYGDLVTRGLLMAGRSDESEAGPRPGTRHGMRARRIPIMRITFHGDTGGYIEV
jgi:hypothetical protein